MELIQILGTVKEIGCDNESLKAIFSIIKNGVFPIIQIGVPILLILMGSIDLGKAVLSSDDKEIKGAVGKLVKRAIAAIAVFFVVTIVQLIMDALPADSGANKWVSCWNGTTTSTPDGSDNKSDTTTTKTKTKTTSKSTKSTSK